MRNEVGRFPFVAAELTLEGLILRDWCYSRGCYRCLLHAFM